MVLKRGDCPALPGGIGEGCPMAFNLTCVESNLKIKFTLAVPLLMGVGASAFFSQELNKTIAEATASMVCSFILVCIWLGISGVDAVLQQLQCLNYFN